MIPRDLVFTSAEFILPLVLRKERKANLNATELRKREGNTSIAFKLTFSDLTILFVHHK